MSDSGDPSDPNGSNSATSLLAILAPTAAYAALWFGLFLLLRPKIKHYYQPRSFLAALRPESRSPKLSDGWFSWMKEFWLVPDVHVLQHHSIDGYLFLRFLKISVICCAVGCAITWPILFPINGSGGGGSRQLDVLTLANVTNRWKYFAHAGCAIIFFTFVIYMITRESIFYINLRQAYLMSPLYSNRLSSRTVMYASVPPDYMDEARLRNILGPTVRRVWLATDVKELEDKVEERNSMALKLENAITKLIIEANKAKAKAEKDTKYTPATDEELALGEDGSVTEPWVPAKKRPTHRLHFVGKKVDTIHYCRAQLAKLIPEVAQMQAQHRSANTKLLNTAFVEFDTVADAQAAFQSVTHHQPLHMAPRFGGVLPGEVIWSNLRIRWWERVIRRTATLAAIVALIIFWAFPVAVVGAISNINSILANPNFQWLSWLKKIPPQIFGVVSGLLPPLALSILMSLVPIICRLAARIGGDPTKSAVELTTQTYYFAFQVVQVFLVATLGSAATAVGAQIAENPTSVVSILAQKLPLAYKFYLSWFVLQGLGVVSGLLLGLSGLVISRILSKLLDKTPRKMYSRWISLSGLGWGAMMPVYTNLFVIALCYATIAPLVLGFAAIGLGLFYLAYRYNIIFVSDADIDTKGRIYPLALQQVFVGLYLAELCMIGLFAVGLGDSRGALGPLVLMIIMLIFTALYQFSLNAALGPLIDYLPKSIDAEERRLVADEDGYNHATAERAVDKEGKYPDDEPTLTTISEAIRFNTGLSNKKPNFFVKWLRPDLYTDYATMRRLVPRDIIVDYTEKQAEEAYFNPAIISEVPLLWIPSDALGVSKEEVRATKSILPITDEGATLDEKFKLVWDRNERPPIYEEQPYY